MVMFCLVTKLCPTLCDPMDCTTPGLPVPTFHGLPKFMMIVLVMSSNRLILCHPLLPSDPGSGSLPVSQLFASGSQIIGASASVQFSRTVVSDSLRPHGLQHARPPCPSPTPRVYSNACPLSQWCHPAISSSVIPFSSCLQSFPASGSFPMSLFFTSGGQSIGASTSDLPMNIQDWFL